MKKSLENPSKETLPQKNRPLSKVERTRLERLAALPDNQIDTSDIPEAQSAEGWVRVHQHPEHPLHRPLSRLLSIRIAEPDIALAQRLAATKGLPYQTYLKSLLHEALEKERRIIDRTETTE